MSRILDKILEKKERKKSMGKYEENKEALEKIIGEPTIKISVKLPEGYENQREQFLELETEEAFLRDVSKSINRIVKKHLRRRQKEKVVTK